MLCPSPRYRVAEGQEEDAKLKSGIGICMTPPLPLFIWHLPLTQPRLVEGKVEPRFSPFSHFPHFHTFPPSYFTLPPASCHPSRTTAFNYQSESTTPFFPFPFSPFPFPFSLFPFTICCLFLDSLFSCIDFLCFYTF